MCFYVKCMPGEGLFKSAETASVRPPLDLHVMFLQRQTSNTEKVYYSYSFYKHFISPLNCPHPNIREKINYHTVDVSPNCLEKWNILNFLRLPLVAGLLYRFALDCIGLHILHIMIIYRTLKGLNLT